MNHLDLYKQYKKGTLTLADWAEVLDIKETSLKIRVTKQGARLPKFLATLDKIASGALTMKEGAELLGVAPRAMSTNCATWKVQKPVSDFVLTRTTATLKWDVRKKFALDFIAGRYNLDQASESAEISTREMRRWVWKLLDKYQIGDFRSLVDTSLRQRRKWAEDIEQAEGLEHAKLRLLETIGAGQRALAEVALEQATDKLRRRKGVPSPTPNAQPRDDREPI